MFAEQNPSTVKNNVPIYFVDETTDLSGLLSSFEHKQLEASNFTAMPGQVQAFFNEEAKLSRVLFGYNNDPFSCAILAQKLPHNLYSFANITNQHALCCLGFALGFYNFDKYKTNHQKSAARCRLLWPEAVDKTEILHIYEAIAFARDLINEPTNYKNGSFFETLAKEFAMQHQAECKIIKGTELHKEFPLVYAVGRAATETEPMLLDISWGTDKTAPLVALVGKGVCFDTGGLDIKSASNMLLMKKDMGGAANILALAKLIISMNLKLRLRVVVPIVENAIAGNAFRPGDILESRAGYTVEIGNTDAEGRLILADALAYIDEEKPDLLIDMATLTGAARVALGPKLPPFFTDDETLATELAQASALVQDPAWRLPLAAMYENTLCSRIADMNNIAMDGFAGSIIAALFLQKFVKHAKSWVHFDIYGWNVTASAAAPIGGEAQCIRMLYMLLLKRYGKH